MDKLDLNVENYDLTDLLNLFKLNIEFTDKDLKAAKTIALKTHPDKSRLDKKFFVFFMKAYKRIEQIYNFRRKKEQNLYNTEYSMDMGDITNEGDKTLLKKLDGKSVKDFNAWFNKMFEKTRVGDRKNDKGYGDWFSSDKDLEDIKVSSTSEFGNYFNNRKKNARELIVHKGIEEMESNVGYSLNRNGLEEYSSSIFSKLNYEDLKKAHTETVVPVTQEDFLSRERYKNVDALKRARETQNVGAISLEQSKQLLNDKRRREVRMTTDTAFNLLKQDEEVRRMNSKWWKEFKQLDN
tara:strand:- start:1704 stop:2588 length:885 start_codon:yes stop_codon:yes gene_type:complete